ncbi:MAG: HEAT repeat domain-containing protein [Acidobacteria bacterium]|nr:HEAT repeat domain-containing protein [Acidobacteriota bacterium]
MGKNVICGDLRRLFVPAALALGCGVAAPGHGGTGADERCPATIALDVLQDPSRRGPLFAMLDGTLGELGLRRPAADDPAAYLVGAVRVLRRAAAHRAERDRAIARRALDAIDESRALPYSASAANARLLEVLDRVRAPDELARALAGLRAPDPLQRKRAQHELQRDDGPLAARLLLATLLDESEDVRANAMRLLVSAIERRGIAHCACAAPGAIDGSWYLRHDGLYARLALVGLLRAARPVAGGEDVLPLLLLRDDPDLAVCSAAAEALAAGLDEPRVDALVALLDQPEEAARWSAASTLALARDSRVLAALGRVKEEDRSARVRAAAANAIATIELNVRLSGDRAVAGTRDPGVLARLERDLGRDDSLLRRKAVSELGMAPGQEATGLLLRATRDADREVRALAIRQLGERQEPSVVARLLALLEGETEFTPLFATIDALASRDDPRIPGALIAVFRRSGDPHLRGAILGRLAAFDDPRVVGPIVEALRGPDPALRLGGATALSIVANRRREFAIAPLLRLLASDPDIGVKDEARRALARIAGVDHGMDIAAWQEWWRERQEAAP